MGNKWNKEDLKKGAILAGALCVVVLFTMMLTKISAILRIVGIIFSALSPIIIGCIIAFLLTPIMNFLKTVFTKLCQKFMGEKRDKKAKKIANGIAVVGTIVIFLALIIGFLWILIPELRDSIMSLYDKVPTYMENIQNWITKTMAKQPELKQIANSYLDTFENTITSLITEKLLPNMDTIILKISSGIVGGIKFAFNFAVGIIIAVYILGSKDVLTAQGKKIIYSTFSKKKGNRVLDALDFANSVFGGFINGKIIDSIIIGIICAVFCNAVQMPYAILVSVVIGITNIIPFFGPFIGAIPSALLILVDDPMMCVVFVIFIIILQQVDGNILGPLILGDSTGLSGLWVMFAILVGGNLFGFAGMLLGVPVFACIYTLLTILLREKLKKKGLANKTEDFLTLRRFDEETGNPIYGPRPKRVSAKKRKKRMQMPALQHAKDSISKQVNHLAEEANLKKALKNSENELDESKREGSDDKEHDKDKNKDK